MTQRITIFLLGSMQLINGQSWWRNSDISYSSYRRIPMCHPSDRIRRPSTPQEVVSIVQEAIRRGTTVKFFGARHSQTDIICTDGIPVDTHGLKKFYLDPVTYTATFGSGVILHEATEFLKSRGRAFKTTPAFGNITIGGAIGTGAHGSTIKYTSSLSSQVASMLIVDGNGEMRLIDDEMELRAFRIHLGLLGAVIEVTLHTSPLYKTLAHNYIVPDSVLTDGTAEYWARTTDQISLYWFPSLGEVVVANWTMVDVEEEGDAWTQDHVPSTYTEFNLASAAAAQVIFKLTDSPCPKLSSAGYSLLSTFEYFMQSTLHKNVVGFVPIYTENGETVRNPAIGYYDKMFAPTCRDGPTPDGLSCSWSHANPAIDIEILDYEVGIDLRDLPRVVRTVKDIARKTSTHFPLQGILMRFSSSSTAYMSNSYGRDTLHFEWYSWLRNDGKDHPPASIAGYQTLMQALVERFGGRPHWGKNGMEYHSKHRLDRKLNHEARSGFIAMMRKYDPSGVFLNNFGERLMGTGRKMDLDTDVKRCALIDNCICRRNEDCGSTQECTTIEGYDTMNVCRTKGEAIPNPLETVIGSKKSTLEFMDWLKSIPSYLVNRGLLYFDFIECANIPTLTHTITSGLGLDNLGFGIG